MRVAIFSDTFPPQIDGVASMVYQSARGLAERGHEVFVFVPSHKQRNISYQEAGFKIIEVPSIPFPGYPDHRVALPTGIGVRFLRDKKIDIIHTHTPFTLGWEAVAASKILRVPLIGTHHTFYDYYLKYVKLDYSWAKNISWKLTAKYYNFCQHILSPSMALADELKRSNIRRDISIMPNPIDTELFSPLKDNADKLRLKEKFGLSGFTAVYMGRVSYEKSIDRVIKAFALAKKTMLGINLMIIGDGPEKKNLEELARKTGCQDSIIFKGFLRGEELSNALRASDVFISASESENMPISILEAMSVGLPIIGVRALGIPEIVTDGVNGFLTSPGDAESMSVKIINFAENKKLREKFSSNAKNSALAFSHRAISERMEKFYRS